MSIAWNSVLFTSTSTIFMQIVINFYSFAIYIATMIIRIVRYLLDQHYADWINRISLCIWLVQLYHWQADSFRITNLKLLPFNTDI